MDSAKDMNRVGGRASPTRSGPCGGTPQLYPSGGLVRVVPNHEYGLGLPIIHRVPADKRLSANARALKSRAEPRASARQGPRREQWGSARRGRANLPDSRAGCALRLAFVREEAIGSLNRSSSLFTKSSDRSRSRG